MPRARLCLVAALGALSTAGVTAPASAFCRSTTCTLACETDDQGCKTGGAKLAWTTGCVGVSVQRDGTTQLPFATVSSIADTALRTWSNVACLDGGNASIAYARLPDATCKKVEYNDADHNANEVIFRDDDWTYEGTANTLAYTTVTFDSSNGGILGADIEVNSAYNRLSTSDTAVYYDLPSILTHEMGHMLGLAHSPDPDATMNASYEMGSITLRDLASDDIDAICAAYPPTRSAVCDPEPNGGFSPDCKGATVPPSAAHACAAAPFGGPIPVSSWALLLAPVLVWSRRLRRSPRRVG